MLLVAFLYNCACLVLFVVVGIPTELCLPCTSCCWWHSYRTMPALYFMLLVAFLQNCACLVLHVVGGISTELLVTFLQNCACLVLHVVGDIAT